MAAEVRPVEGQAGCDVAIETGGRLTVDRTCRFPRLILIFACSPIGASDAIGDLKRQRSTSSPARLTSAASASSAVQGPAVTSSPGDLAMRPVWAASSASLALAVCQPSPECRIHYSNLDTAPIKCRAGRPGGGDRGHPLRGLRPRADRAGRCLSRGARLRRPDPCARSHSCPGRLDAGVQCALTPHMAGYSGRAERAVRQQAIRQALKVLGW
jgi:hypothetical protein